MEKEILDIIKESFNGRFNTKEKRPGVIQLYLPLYHEDGDMVEIYLTTDQAGRITLSDFGMTIMRLSYSFYDLDSPHKIAIFKRILDENGMIEDGGHIKFRTKHETLYTDILHFCQVVAKIGSMQHFRREVIESLFLEMLDEYIEDNLREFRPQAKINPLENRTELEVDYQFRPNGHPVYLFAVKDATKAKLTTISCLEFKLHSLNFRSVVVHEDFEKLPKKDRSMLTNACDKQYTNLDEFKSDITSYLERERK